MRLLFGAVLLVLGFASPAVAQSKPSPTANANALQLNFGTHYGPATEASLKIQAEAQAMLARGQYEKDRAEARKIQAEARALEGTNAVQAVRDYIEKRELREADRNKRIGENLAKGHKVNERKWEQLSNLPELNFSQIETGVALNFLMDRLSATFVTFRSNSMGSVAAAQSVAAKLTIPTEVVHSLRVRQKLAGGESVVFRLDEGPSVRVEWWPPVLRTPELRAVRDKFKAARAAIFADIGREKSEEEFYEAIRQLERARQALEGAFYQEQDRSIRFKNGHSFRRYLEGTTFLKALADEIRRLDSLGGAGAFSQSLLYRGRFLPELLAHMVRNGLEFAPAKKGEEQAYQQIFHMLRDLYKAVEADADQPDPANGPG